MPSHENNWFTGKIVLVSAAAGLVVLLLLMWWLGFAFWSSFLWGLVVGVVVYIILTLNYAGQAGTGDGYASHGAEQSGGTGAGTTGAAAPASSSGTGAAAPAPGSAANVAPAPAAAPSKDVAKEASPAAGKAKPKNDSLGEDYDKDGVHEGTDEGAKPEMLSEARAGGADNLKEIKGVGPKMEQMLNQMGVYHFDQVAGWSADEVAWVDANLKGFKGRVSRDGWVDQAKILAAGGETEFSKRVDKGGVY